MLEMSKMKKSPKNFQIISYLTESLLDSFANILKTSKQSISRTFSFLWWFTPNRLFTTLSSSKCLFLHSAVHTGTLESLQYTLALFLQTKHQPNFPEGTPPSFSMFTVIIFLYFRSSVSWNKGTERRGTRDNSLMIPPRNCHIYVSYGESAQSSS